MAVDLQLQKVPVLSDEQEFLQVLGQVGGRGSVYLVGDVGRKEGESKCSLMKEFVSEVFPEDDRPGETNSNGEIKPECYPGSKGHHRPQPELGARMRAKSDKARAMHCALVVFIFRHAYVHDQANQACVREVLKDVRTRTEGHGVRPALLGLIHAHSESPQTSESVELLENMLRSVFSKHSDDSIWAGLFIPKAPDTVQTIKRKICKAVLCAQATATDNFPPGRRGRFIWPLQQWFRRGPRRGPRGRPSTASDTQVQKGGAEEGIPLKTRDEPRL